MSFICWWLMMRSECVRAAAQWTAEAQRVERASGAPSGVPCEACAALRFDRAMAEAPGRSRPPRSGDDEPDDGEPDPSPTATDPADNRPGCSATTGARSPQPYFDRLTAAVERLNAARSLSRQLHALAGEAPIITNEQLALADRLRALP